MILMTIIMVISFLCAIVELVLMHGTMGVIAERIWDRAAEPEKGSVTIRPEFIN